MDNLSLDCVRVAPRTIETGVFQVPMKCQSFLDLCLDASDSENHQSRHRLKEFHN